MNYKLVITLIALLLNVRKIGAISKTMIENFVTLTSDVQDFYKSSSIVLIYANYSRDWDFEKHLFDIIKEFSQNYIISQVVNYENMEYWLELQITDNKTSATEPLYVLRINTDIGLAQFQKKTKDWNMSMFTWFISIYNGTSIDCENPVGNPFNLKMDTRMIVICENSKSIKKYFSIFRDTTEVVDIAAWNPGTKLVFEKDDNRLQVQKNMRGITLKLAQNKPWTKEDNKNIVDYLNHLIELLQDISNFTSKVVIENDELGYYNETTKEWSGIMRIMKDKEADMALVLLSVAVHRMAVLDFPVPLLLANCRLYAKLPDTITVKWSAYFDMFNGYAWITICLVVVTLSVMLALTKTRFHKPLFSIHLIFENLINIWGIYCQQGLPEIPLNTPTQILYFSILLSSLVLFAVYSATITSYIAVLKATLPFSTYDEFMQQPYKVGVIRGSRDELLVYSEDWLLSRLAPRLINHDDLPINPYDGCKQACNDNVVFYTNDVSYGGISRKLPCILSSLRLPRNEYQAIALLKNSPYTEIINYNIMRLMDNGLLKRLKSTHFYKYTKLPITRPTIIDFGSVIPILMIWTTGFITSLAILCIETTLYDWRRFLYRRKLQRRSQNVIRRLSLQRFRLSTSNIVFKS